MANVSPQEIELFKNFADIVADDSVFDSSIVQKPQGANIYDSPDELAQMYLDYADVPVQSFAPMVQPVIANKVEVLEEPHESVKSIKVYKLKLGNIILINRIYSKDVANFIMNELNSGKSFDDSLVLGILSLGLQYTKNIDSLSSVMKTRQISLRNMDYESAKQHDAEIKKRQDDALKIMKLITSKVITK